ncbi:hypothetical protein GF386_01355, partial [Candidatus Pacearchaeota archaeon]|nr:hypothetical protein [Candidatus Pacearchaeota archaeon]
MYSKRTFRNKRSLAKLSVAVLGMLILITSLFFVSGVFGVEEEAQDENKFVAQGFDSDHKFGMHVDDPHHDSEITVTPSIVPQTTGVTFTAHVENTGNDADIHEFRVYENDEFFNFVCNSVPGWYDPIIGFTTIEGVEYKYCQWAAKAGNEIEPGETEDFTFDADTPETECCRTWFMETRDPEGTYIFHQPEICVDTTKPETTKSFSPEGTYKIDGEKEWVDTATVITLDSTDSIGPHDNGVKVIYWRNLLAEGNEPCNSLARCNEIQTVDPFNEELNPGEGDFSVDITKDEESCHILEFYAVDNTGNIEELKRNCFFVDKTPPEGIKEIGDPNVPCNGQKLALILENKNSNWDVIDDDFEATLEYNTIGSEFEYSVDGKVPLPNTEYALIYYADKPDRFDDWGGNNPGALIDTEDSGSDGSLTMSGNKDLGMNLPHPNDWNADPDPDYCDYNNGYDNYTHCKGAKIWLVPTDALPNDYPDDGSWAFWDVSGILFETDLLTYTSSEEECYWVRDPTNLPGTPIKLTCTDQGPHPSGDEEVCFRVSYDIEPWLTKNYCNDVEGEMQGQEEDDWCCVDKEAEIIFKEDSQHDLEYFCRDAVNKTSEIDLEYFKVDSLPPIITKTMIGEDHLGDCPPDPEPSDDECYVADDGENGVHIDVKDDDSMDCAVGVDFCTYGLWWLTDQTTCENKYGENVWDGSKCNVEAGDFGEEGVDIIFREDSTHDLYVNCWDELGNEINDEEEFLVDSTPPETTKTYGEPQ